MPDAVVIGAGPNGLVGANYLASAGWDVVCVEAQPEPGGAARSGELTGEPGFVHDYFSAFYPLSAASPAFRPLDLEAHGLRWRRTPLVVRGWTVLHIDSRGGTKPHSLTPFAVVRDGDHIDYPPDQQALDV